MALADQDRHGYAIIQDVAMRTDGALKLSADTLYRSIQRMLEQGLLAETRERPDPDEDDERRRGSTVGSPLAFETNPMKSKLKTFVPLKLWRETQFSCTIRQRPLPVHASATRHILFLYRGIITAARGACGSRSS
jgi:hypothetical protein